MKVLKPFKIHVQTIEYCAALVEEMDKSAQPSDIADALRDLSHQMTRIKLRSGGITLSPTKNLDR